MRLCLTATHKSAQQSSPWQLDLGAHVVTPSSVHFRVWAPKADAVAVRLVGQGRRSIAMQPIERGYFETTVECAEAGDRYLYVLDGVNERPDPASRFQPDGVHGLSAVVNPHDFHWTDRHWRGLPLTDLIIYELHIGTFTEEGTFEALLPWLDYLKHDVGITALELMPVAQFPGTRNWGYDGVYPFAPQSSYGGPQGLKTLVNACHAKGLAVVLDVVYNHLGPEGNYLGDFGPYFTDRYKTPWGAAVNYDGPESDAVRHYVVNNALYWVTEYHIDALRLDAIHGIFDFSATHILEEVAAAVHAQARRLDRTALLIAESGLNDRRIIAPPAEGGYGLDGQWNDDFHHALRTVLTGEHFGYYQDFSTLGQLATALQENFVYTGQHSSYRRRRHGNSARGCAAAQFVIFSQNHDQVGNRARGDRLATLVPFGALKAAAALILLAPQIPLLFMGEEYGESAPFQYFIEHGDPRLIQAVKNGRKEEFSQSGRRDEDIPDPQDPATFARCRVRPGPQADTGRAALLRWYRRLIELRKLLPMLAAADSNRYGHQAIGFETERVLLLHRWVTDGAAAFVLVGFNRASTSVFLREPVGHWRLHLDAGWAEFGGASEAALPATLVIPPTGISVTVPAYGVSLYLSSGDE